MATKFERIYKKFLNQIKDISLQDLTDEELEQILFDYLENATVEFRQCRKDLTNIDIDLQQFNEDLSMEEVYIISYGMVLNWIRNKINKEELLRQSIGDRDFKLTSNWETLGKLNDIEENIEKNLQKYISRYQYIPSEIK